jgi:hypothetical protein
MKPVTHAPALEQAHSVPHSQPPHLATWKVEPSHVQFLPQVLPLAQAQFVPQAHSWVQAQLVPHTQASVESHALTAVAQVV